MTFPTTCTKAVTVLESAGCENVYETPITSTRRDANEAARGIAAATNFQSWEIMASPIEAHEGASGYQRTRARIRIRAWWFHKDQDPTSLVAFRTQIAVAQRALANPETGFPNIAAPGIQPFVEPEWPRRSPTGQVGWYAEFGFETLDVEHT